MAWVSPHANAPPHTRSESLEMALRDDLATLRKELYQRDQEVARLKKQVSQLQQLQAPSSFWLCGCFTSFLRTLCPCWCQPRLAQQLLAEHRIHEYNMNEAASTSVEEDAGQAHRPGSSGLQTASEHEQEVEMAAFLAAHYPVSSK